MCVEMMYSKKSKSLDECILNIIKLKMKQYLRRKKALAGRKSKLENSNTNRTWAVAEYIRLSQEDEGIRRRQTRKQQYNKPKSTITRICRRTQRLNYLRYIYR